MRLGLLVARVTLNSISTIELQFWLYMKNGSTHSSVAMDIARLPPWNQHTKKTDFRDLRKKRNWLFHSSKQHEVYR